MFIFLLDSNLEKMSGSAPSIPRDVLGLSYVDINKVRLALGVAQYGVA